MTIESSATPVRKSVTVRATPAEAFAIFTDDFDSWWPRSHHIGRSPMKRASVEGRTGGRCYTLQEDGTECDWGTVLVWEPPHRLVLAWQIRADWQYEPNLAKSSEVEVMFAALADGRTRVDLEHRFFERMGPAAAAMRSAVDSSNGWTGTLALYVARVER
jgi:uncharacterized protein YndB with AHSA1/START domain